MGDGWCAVYYQSCNALFISQYLWGHRHSAIDVRLRATVCILRYVSECVHAFEEMCAFVVQVVSLVVLRIYKRRKCVIC